MSSNTQGTSGDTRSASGDTQTVPGDTRDLLQQLRAESDIRHALLTWFRASDAEDWDGVRAHTSSDFSMSVSAQVSKDAAAAGGESIRGVEGIITVLRAL